MLRSQLLEKPNRERTSNFEFANRHQIHHQQNFPEANKINATSVQVGLSGNFNVCHTTGTGLSESSTNGGKVLPPPPPSEESNGTDTPINLVTSGTLRRNSHSGIADSSVSDYLADATAGELVVCDVDHSSEPMNLEICHNNKNDTSLIETPHPHSVPEHPAEIHEIAGVKKLDSARSSEVQVRHSDLASMAQNKGLLHIEIPVKCSNKEPVPAERMVITNFDEPIGRHGNEAEILKSVNPTSHEISLNNNNGPKLSNDPYLLKDSSNNGERFGFSSSSVLEVI